MSQEILNHVTAEATQKRVPVLKSGYTVRVHQRIKEGEKERTQIFEGLIIRLSSGTGVNRTFTVRKMIDGIGVEKIYPLYSPNIEQIEVLKQGRVRRAKLYYMRDLTGKSARLRDVPLGEIKMIGSESTPEPEEAPAAETAIEPAQQEVAPAAAEEKTEKTEEAAKEE